MNLVELTQPVWDDMVKELEHKLAQAKEGKLRGFVMSYEYSDSTGGHLIMRDSNCSPYKLLGGLEVAKLELVDRLRQ